MEACIKRRHVICFIMRCSRLVPCGSPHSAEACSAWGSVSCGGISCVGKYTCVYRGMCSSVRYAPYTYDNCIV